MRLETVPGAKSYWTLKNLDFFYSEGMEIHWKFQVRE